VFERSNVANVGFVVGERCVAVIDTGGSPHEGQALRCAILQQTDLPVCYVINSHVHPDHILGNAALQGNGVEFVGHAKLERAMALLGTTYLERASRQAGYPLGAQHIVLPDRVVSQTLELDLGGRVLNIAAYPKAHTNTDLSIYDIKTRTLWLSDLLFMEHIPVVAGSIKGWLEVIKTLREIPAERVIPGHGPVQAPWPKAAQGLTRYLTVLLEETREWITDDGDLAGAMHRVGESERANWKLFDDYHKRNVSAAYTELEWD
jgi:quinoprotein relay system zinc metallohydrolase 2